MRAIAAGGLVLVAATLALALMPRRPADTDYFGPNEPMWVRVPTTFGDPVYVGVAVLHAARGDTVELESVTIEGIEGEARVEPLARILGEETRIVGAINASGLGDAIDLSSYRAPAGLRFRDSDGPVELSVRIDGTAPIHGFYGLWLRFRLNDAGSALEDWIPLRASICTGATSAEAVERCRPIEAEMHGPGL